MSSGTGTDAQLGFAAQSAYDTYVTPDHFYEFNSEALALEPTWLEPTPIRSGRLFKSIDDIIQSRVTVSGDVAVNVVNHDMGLLVKHALGSNTTPQQIGTTSAYKQVHTPGQFLGYALSAQVGRPEPSSGTVYPFNYTGLKVASWEFSLTDGEIPTISFSFDGRQVDSTGVTLATPSYPSGIKPFSFINASLTIGGTPDTSSGETTLTGATAIATVVNETTLSGENPMAVERYGIGNDGLKNEPLINEIRTLTGSLGAEFNKEEIYNVFENNTTTALKLTLTGDEIGTSGEFDTVEFLMPTVKFKSSQPTVEGREVVTASTEIEAYTSDDHPPVQVTIVSSDQNL